MFFVFTMFYTLVAVVPTVYVQKLLKIVKYININFGSTNFMYGKYLIVNKHFMSRSNFVAISISNTNLIAKLIKIAPSSSGANLIKKIALVFVKLTN